MHIVVVDKTGKFTGTAGTVLERFAFVSKGVDAKNVNGDNNYYVTVVNRSRKYVWWLAAPGINNTTYGTTVVSAHLRRTTCYRTSRQHAGGGQTDNANVGDSALQTAYDLFKNADQIDISLVITGPASAVLASYVIQNICESAWIAWRSSRRPSNVVNNVGSEVSASRRSATACRQAATRSSTAGWKYMNDKYNDVFRWIPLNGDMAGIAARSRQRADPWFSPAGVNRGNVKNVVKLAWNPKQLDRDDLYKMGVNPVVQFPGQGTVLWGDKTLLASVRLRPHQRASSVHHPRKDDCPSLADAVVRIQRRVHAQPVPQHRGTVSARREGSSRRRGLPRHLRRQQQHGCRGRTAEPFVGDIYVKPHAASTSCS
jgi:hypothetical protein